MKSIRRALLQFVVLLTAAATALAGTPTVRCGCERGVKTVKTVQEAAPCCCCSHSQDQDQTPTCCEHAQQPSPSDEELTFQRQGCHKVIVHTSDAAVATEGKSPFHAVSIDFAQVSGRADRSACVAVPVGNDSPQPPPIDLQLVLQHFLI